MILHIERVFCLCYNLESSNAFILLKCHGDTYEKRRYYEEVFYKYYYLSVTLH